MTLSSLSVTIIEDGPDKPLDTSPTGGLNGYEDSHHEEATTMPIMMPSYSIAEARNRFAELVHDLDRVSQIEVTRRGQPVAVLVSVTEFERLRTGGPTFWNTYTAFADAVDLAALNIEPEVFIGLRELSPGREMTWCRPRTCLTPTWSPSRCDHCPTRTCWSVWPRTRTKSPSPPLSGTSCGKAAIGCLRLPSAQPLNPISAKSSAVRSRSRPTIRALPGTPSNGRG